MDVDDLEVATRFRTALAETAKTGDWTRVYPLLAPDVEWITPKRTLTSLEEIEHDLTWGTPPQHLDLEFHVGEWVDLGEGRVFVDVHQVYRVKGSGDLAYARDRRIEITIHDGKISRYEMKIIG